MQVLKKPLKLLALALAVVSVYACSMAMNSPVADATPEPSRRQVQRGALRAPVWRLVYCLEDGADGTELISLLHELAAAQPMGKQIEVIDCATLAPDSLAAGPVSFFGNRLPAGVSASLLAKSSQGLRFDKRIDVAGDDVLLLPSYRSPWSKTPTIAAFFYANDPQTLASALRARYGDEWRRLFWGQWAYEVLRANGDRVYGSYADTSWAFDVAEEIVMKSPETPVYDAGGLKVFVYDGVVNKQAVALAVSGVTQVKQLLDSLTGQTTDWYPEVRLYPTLERIGLRRDHMAPVQYAAEDEVLHLVPAFLDEDRMLTSFVLWQPFLEHAASGSFPGHNLALLTAALQHQLATSKNDAFTKVNDQALRLWQTGLLHGTAQLDREQPSELINEAIARVYAAGMDMPKSEAILATIKTAGQKEFPAKVFGAYSVPDYSPAALAHRAMPPGKLAGMTFAHVGYRVHNGYGGEKIQPSMDSLAELKVNALAIVPYTFMREPDKPTLLPIPEDAGGENDWATLCSARAAGQRGWSVLLKPQIWLGGGHWPGDVDFATDEEWETFFAEYTYWIMHYALLAEREGIPALCLGTELVKTTLKQPDRWRELIRKIRMVYGGQLTYAANWGEEFEGFTFWEDLDAIGLNGYYPLSEKDDPTDEELLAGARSWLQMAQQVSLKTQRPLWLTEVGYRSVAGAWKNPHADAGDRPSDGGAQARCYRALLTASGETPELKGIFFWKWPSFLGGDYGPDTRREFAPGGTPAAAVLENFYQGWK